MAWKLYVQSFVKERYVDFQVKVIKSKCRLIVNDKISCLPENPSAEVIGYIRKSTNENDRGKSPTLLFLPSTALAFYFPRRWPFISIVLLFIIHTEQAWQLLTTLSSTPTDWAT